MIGDRWGATVQETRADYPCDDHAPGATLRAWRAVTIEAPIDTVWDWLVQLRMAPYSYDWLDNLGRRSPRTFLDLADPEVGDPFSATAGRPVGRIVALRRHDHLTAQIMGTTMTYRLSGAGPGRTRLVLKIVGVLPRGLAAPVCLGDLLMARRQLLNLKRYAEQRG